MFGSATLLKLMVELGISDPQNVTQKLGEVGEAGKVADEKIKPLGGTTGADGSAGKAAIGIGLIAGALAVGKAAKEIWDMALSTSKYADSLLNLSEKTGISVGPLQEWLHVFASANVSTEQFAVGMNGLTNKLQEALNPTSKAAKMFESLGVSIVDSNGKLKSMDEIFPALISKLADLENQVERNALMNDLFGRSGTNLVPILAEGSKKIEEQIRLYKEQGIAMDENFIRKTAKFQESARKMNESFQSIKDNIAGLIAQGFTPLVDAITLKMIPAWNTLKDVVTPIFKIIWTSWVFMKDEIMGAWKFISGMLTFDFPKAWEGAKEVTMGFVNVVKGIWTTIKDSVIKGINEIKPTIIAKWNELINGVIKPAVDLATKAYDWGKNIVTGLWNGITSLGGWVTSQITAWVKSHITTPVKKLLGIESPSKVFYGYGVNIGQGLINGLVSMYDNVDSAFNRLWLSYLMPQGGWVTVPKSQPGNEWVTLEPWKKENSVWNNVPGFNNEEAETIGEEVGETAGEGLMDGIGNGLEKGESPLVAIIKNVGESLLSPIAELGGYQNTAMGIANILPGIPTLKSQNFTDPWTADQNRIRNERTMRGMDFEKRQAEKFGIYTSGTYGNQKAGYDPSQYTIIFNSPQPIDAARANELFKQTNAELGLNL